MKSVITMSILAAALQFAPVTFGQDPSGAGKGMHHPRAMFANLSPDEREKMRVAHQKAMQDPVTRAAHEKMRQARKDFRDALRAAMLKADPTVQPILDKMPKGEHDEG